MTLKTYRVSIPIAGTVSRCLLAASPEEAIEKAWDTIGEYEPGNDDFYVDWNFYPRLVTGNVLHAPDNSVSVEED